MNAKQLNPPPMKINITLFDQIDFYRTGEMSKLGAESIKERAKRTIQAYSKVKKSPKAVSELKRLVKFVTEYNLANKKSIKC